MLTGSEVIILNNLEAKRLLAACGFIPQDLSATIHADIEERFSENGRRFTCDAHDAAMIVIKLRNVIRELSDMSVWDSE
jgi:fructose-1-phosphate kinase PfkB-like protein